MQRWYLVRTKTGQQDRAEYNLGAQCFEVYNPKWLVETPRATKLLPVFERYIFVKFDPDIEPASLINSTRGVSNLVGFGGSLAVVPDEAIDSIKARYQKLQTKERMTKGQQVAVMDGAFVGLDAVFDSRDGETRSFLLLELMGRQQKLSFKNEHFN